METAVGVICWAAIVVMVVGRSDKWMDRAIVAALLMLAGVTIAAITTAL